MFYKLKNGSLINCDLIQMIGFNENGCWVRTNVVAVTREQIDITGVKITTHENDIVFLPIDDGRELVEFLKTNDIGETKPSFAEGE